MTSERSKWGCYRLNRKLMQAEPDGPEVLRGSLEHLCGGSAAMKASHRLPQLVCEPATGLLVACRRWFPFARVNGLCEMRPMAILDPCGVCRYRPSRIADYFRIAVILPESGGNVRWVEGRIMTEGDPAAPHPSAPALVRGQRHGRLGRCRSRECRSRERHWLAAVPRRSQGR